MVMTGPVSYVASMAVTWWRMAAEVSCFVVPSARVKAGAATTGGGSTGTGIARGPIAV